MAFGKATSDTAIISRQIPSNQIQIMAVMNQPMIMMVMV
jgi:hypothetical protein